MATIRRSTTSLFLLGVLLFSATLLLAACGDDDDDEPGDDVTATPTSQTATETETETATASPSATNEATSTTSPSATDEASPSTTTVPTSGETACEIQPQGEVTAYNRPSTEAEEFGVMPTDRTFPVSGETAEGWIGFVPAVAQAGNVGPFRSRFLPPDGAYELTGECDNLPELPSLPAGVCFTMAMGDVTVYTDPESTADEAFTLAQEEWAEVLDSSGSGAEQWLQVEGATGEGEGMTGWIAGQDAAFNGPCDEYQAP